ncbi:MAG: adenine methylase [Frankiaceae bacterium]|jgi:DNA adenine methylase|nr:adenine methylase [Frankiaceae bacterium]
MGSKQRLLGHIADVAAHSSRRTFVDAFSGSGCVAHHMKSRGYRVVTNDVLAFAYHWARAAVENSSVRLTPDECDGLLAPSRNAGTFIADTFADLYFTDDENALLDAFSENAAALTDPYAQSLAYAAMTRACLKRRPRGVFTYVGMRYDDGRADLRTSLADHFRASVDAWNAAVFDNGLSHEARHGSATSLDIDEPSLVYVDPPYFSTRSDNDYTRRYHFLEGLVSYWRDLELQPHTKTKKFASPHREFQTRAAAYASFETLFDVLRVQGHDVLVSYSSNCLPSKDEMLAMLRARWRCVDVVSVEHVYSFGTHGHRVGNANNRVEEYLFLAR